MFVGTGLIAGEVSVVVLRNSEITAAGRRNPSLGFNA